MMSPASENGYRRDYTANVPAAMAQQSLMVAGMAPPQSRTHKRKGILIKDAQGRDNEKKEVVKEIKDFFSYGRILLQ